MNTKEINTNIQDMKEVGLDGKAIKDFYKLIRKIYKELMVNLIRKNKNLIINLDLKESLRKGIKIKTINEKVKVKVKVKNENNLINID
jgi:hypothetical protein